jgi:GAF domain-containing protein
MDAPLHVSGEMEGVVCHEHVGGAREWMPDEQLFAIAIANLVSQAISLQTRSPAGRG